MYWLALAEPGGDAPSDDEDDGPPLTIVDAVYWYQAQQLLQEWDITCEKMMKLTCCSLCGNTVFGTSPAPLKPTPNPIGVPGPYAISNAAMADCCQTPDGKWLVCKRCQTDEGEWSRENLVLFEPDYTNRLMSIDAQQAQLLGMLDVALDMQRRMSGIVGVQSDRCILDGPLINWTAASEEQQALPQQFEELLATNLDTNPLMQNFMTVAEHEHSNHGVPVIGAASVQRIVGAAIGRRHHCPGPGACGRRSAPRGRQPAGAPRCRQSGKSPIAAGGEKTVEVGR